MEIRDYSQLEPGAQLVDAWWSLTQAIKHHVAPVIVREHGVDFKDFIALNLIDHGALYPGLLCERMSLIPSAGSRVLEDLSRHQLVERMIDPGDSRRVRLNITPKGEAILEAARATTLELLQRGLDHLTDPQQRAFAEGIRTLAQRLGEESSAAKPLKTLKVQENQ